MKTNKIIDKQTLWPGISPIHYEKFINYKKQTECLLYSYEKDNCNHESVDVGFIKPKFVCKKCDKDL